MTTQLLIPSNILWLPLCRIYKFGLNTLPSKTVVIPYTCGLSCYRGGLAAPTTPTAGQAIPPLTHTPCYSAVMTASHRSRTSEPSYSSPHGHPLPCLPRLHIIPFLGLVVVHRLGALGAAWSTWSRNDFHRKSTVRGEADSWVHGRSWVHSHNPVFL